MYEGQNVILREYRKEDIPLRLNYLNDTEVCCNITPDVPYPITLHEEEKWFEAITAVSDTYKFAIEAIENNQFIGGCSINGVDWKNSVVTIGIFIRNCKINILFQSWVGLADTFSFRIAYPKWGQYQQSSLV